MKDRKGFTLIELLVVVAVLALLASIVFSNLGGAREGARISNALSFQSQTHSLLGSDLVGWWNFNDPNDRYKDISGYDNHGSCTSCPIPADGVPGTLGNAMEFNGINNRLLIPTSDVHNFSNKDTTILAWFKRTGNAGRLMGKRSGGTPGSGYDFQIGTSISLSHRADGSNLSLSSVVDSDIWYNVVVVIEDELLSEARMYLNGDVVDTSTFGELIDRNTSLSIGARQATDTNFFGGLIDDVRIYSRALTASEIQTLYAQTKDKYLANE